MKKIKLTIEKYNLKPEITIYKNPQQSDIRFLLEKYNELRCILDYKNNALWVWDAHESATHIDIEKYSDIISTDNEYLYIKMENSNLMYRHHNPHYSSNRIKNHPKIVQALGNDITIKSIMEAKSIV